MISLTNKKTILFLGIGGVSMHQLALAFNSLGFIVFGYDEKQSLYTNECEKNGIKVEYGFNKNFLNVDVCIKTAAIKDDNKYIKLLKSRGCKIVDRAEALAYLANKFKCVVAVAGTHGKSTTSALIYEMLKKSGKKVSCHIGADIGNPRFDLNDDYLVVEACEYNKSFLSLKPNIAVVTNVEAEHLDSYGNLFNLRNAFVAFVKMSEKRYAFLDKSTKFLKKINNVKFVDKTNQIIEPLIKGDYNLKNISLAMAVCKDLGVNAEDIKYVAENFKGLPRRNEFIGCYNGAKFYIDYAHHPTEIKEFASMFCAEHKNILIVFQPHTYSRTKSFLKDFVNVLSKNNVVIFKEYPAREKISQGLSAYRLYKEIKKVNCFVKYSANIKSLKKYVVGYENVAFVGAGDINKVAEMIMK